MPRKVYRSTKETLLADLSLIVALENVAKLLTVAVHAAEGTAYKVPLLEIDSQLDDLLEQIKDGQ